MEVLALVSAAATFNVVHADDHRVFTAVHHASLQGVSIAAVTLAPRAVTALEFSTNLARVSGSTNQHLPFIILRPNIATQHNCTHAAYLQLVCAHMFLCGGAVGHGCQAGGTPRNQQGSTGQQLRHQAHAWAHVAQVWTECHTGTRCQGGRHWECCLRDGENDGDQKQNML